jgi:hypothetical protein
MTRENPNTNAERRYRSHPSLPPVTAMTLLPVVLIALGAGCSTDGAADAAAGSWVAEIDTIGDTIVVRTLSGSEWGTARLVPELRIGAIDGADHEMFGAITGLAVADDGTIYIYDRQVPALRRYGPDGHYLGTLGRQGGGPGEYANSDGGLAVLADGRVVLRDPGNARFSVFGPEGDYLESWPTRGGMFVSTPLYPGRADGFYSAIFTMDSPLRLVAHGADGTPGDTLPPPDRGIDVPMLRAEAEGVMQSWVLPFSSRAVWAFHPDGFYVSAVSDAYQIDLLRPNAPVLRIARSLDAVPVLAAERSAAEERVFSSMRRVDPAWRWSGPAIPQTKPIIRDLFAGADGTIWVQLHQRGERIPEEELPESASATPQFREAVVFDVFDEDGRYRGRVEAPVGFATYPNPVFRGEHVWSTERDELGVQYLVRYRIDRAAAVD